MRQQRDADAEFLDLRRAFVDLARHAALLQAERQRETADSSTDDGDAHHSALMCAVLTTPAQRPASRVTSRRKSSGVLQAGSMPWVWKVVRTSGAARMSFSS